MLLFARRAAALLLLAASASAAPVELRPAPVPLDPAAAAGPALEAKAAELAAHYALQLPAARAQTEALFEGLGEVTARAKSADSIAAKLEARGVDASDESAVERTLRDGVGVRLTLDDASPQGVEALVERLTAAFEGGRLRATFLSNFHAAQGGLPYLSQSQTARLAAAAGRGGAALKVRRAEKALIPAGYTAIHMNVVFDNGAAGELQIRGRRVHELAEREHASYDARRGKRPRAKAERSLEGLSEAQNRAYLSYLDAVYAHARRAEMYGLETAGPQPRLPRMLAERPDLSLTRP